MAEVPKAANGVPLQQWFEERLTTLQEIILERFDKSEKVLDKVEHQLGQRISDQAGNVDRRFAQIEKYKEETRHMVELIKDQMMERVRALELYKANMEGRMLTLSTVAGLITILISVLLNYFLRKVLE